LVAVGKYAGYSGMIEILHLLGKRLLYQGYNSPFLNVSRAFNYFSVEDAKTHIRCFENRLRIDGKLGPLIFLFTGNGNVTQGALEIFQQMPHKFITVQELKKLTHSKNFNHNVVYGVKLKMSDYLLPRNGNPSSSFVPEDYIKYGKEKYKSIFQEEILPHISVLINGHYWDERYPRLVTNDHLKKHPESQKRLLAVADISCDLNGSLEFTDHATTIEKPFYIRNPNDGSNSFSLQDPGFLVMSIDNLPAELPYEASNHFSTSLYPFISELMAGKNDNPVIRKSLITENGILTPEHKHLYPLVEKFQGKKILVLGSGRVAGPLVQYLCESQMNYLTIGTNCVEEGEKFKSFAKKREIQVKKLDVTDNHELKRAISENDLVIR
jgi:alpha-aminoadipic semialdehyde synthase